MTSSSVPPHRGTNEPDGLPQPLVYRRPVLTQSAMGWETGNGKTLTRPTLQVRLAPREFVLEVADALHRRPVLRVAFFTAMLAGLAGIAAWTILRPYSGDLPSGLHLPWPVIAAASCWPS